MKVEFSEQIFPKKKFTKRLQVGADSFQADRHDADNSHFAQFFERT
jgi:hypothetical protein